MSFVYQHQVVSLKGVYGHGFLAHLLFELGDFQNLNRLPGKEPAAFLVEDLRVDAGLFKLSQVLLG